MRRAEGAEMATTSDKSGTPAAGDVEVVAQRVRELSEQVISQARSNGLAWLEGYERVLRDLLELEEQAAKSTGTEWVQALAATHANFVRDTSEVFLGAVRNQLKS